MFPLILLQAKAVRFEYTEIQNKRRAGNVSINSPSGEGGEVSFDNNNVMTLEEQKSFH